MNEELKKLNSDVLKSFLDFMNSLYETTDIEEQPYKRYLAKMIICLLASGGRETITVYARRKNDEWQEKECSNIVLKSIDWIKSNLDVWEVTELPEEKFTEHLYLRNFKFERKGVDFSLDGVINTGGGIEDEDRPLEV